MQRHEPVVYAAVLVCCIAVVYSRIRRRRATPLHLVRDSQGGEALVVEGREGAFFLVDTAYAGPPVLSTSYLAARELGPGPRTRRSTKSIAERYLDALRDMDAVGDDQRRRGVTSYFNRSTCRSFTSGCVMRLMSIGATDEAQADMFLCPSLREDDDMCGDVFVTHPLPHTVHIITLDYLLHRGPVMIRPRAQTLLLRAARPVGGMCFLPARMTAGALSVEIRVGGEMLSCVLDTGAVAGLCISPDSAKRIRTCNLPHEPKSLVQVGVNGERVCSDEIHADVSMGTHDVGTCPVLINAIPVDGSDGYAGLAFLRAFDMWISHREVGVRRSGLPVLQSPALRDGTCPGSVTDALTCMPSDAR